MTKFCIGVYFTRVTFDLGESSLNGPPERMFLCDQLWLSLTDVNYPSYFTGRLL